MNSKKNTNNIIAVAFALALILSSSAQASNLLGLDRDAAPRAAAEQSIGLFAQVSAWLTGAWSDLTSAFAADTTTTTTTTITAAGCDAGWGLDPEGCPR